MKKFLLLTTLLCGWMGSAMAADGENYVTVKKANASAGNVTVELEMFNPTLEAVAFQCDVKAPEGVTFTMDDVVVEVAADRKVDHTKAYNVLDDGKTLRIVCYSMSNSAFEGKEGTVATFTMPLTSSVTFTVDNVVIADKASLSDKSNGHTGEITIGGSGKYGDVNGNNVVDDVDLALVINYILGRPIPYEKSDVDINGNNVVDDVDLSEIINVILGK